MEIVVNLKTYKQGVQVFKLAKLIKKLNLENKIFLAVQPTDISLVKSLTKLRPYSQHVDFHDKGKNTGFIIPEAIKASGARGSLLNHSEHKIPFCGAGISSIEDIIESKNLGCDGVLISSEITKSKNPAKLLKKMKSIK